MAEVAKVALTAIEEAQIKEAVAGCPKVAAEAVATEIGHTTRSKVSFLQAQSPQTLERATNLSSCRTTSNSK